MFAKVRQNLEGDRTNVASVTFRADQSDSPPLAKTFQLESFAVARDDISHATAPRGEPLCSVLFS